MTITAQVDGQVRTLPVAEGATVAANDVVAELANARIDRDVAFARAQRELIEARLNRGGAPASAANPRAGSLAITARIVEVRRQRLEKMRQLRRTNDVTSRELEQAELEYLAALREYNERRLSPVVAADPELLRIERDKFAADERLAEERQGLLTVATPISGVVTRLHVILGQFVSPRDPIAEVSDSSTLHVRGQIAPELLRYVRPGLPVDVRLLSVPVRAFADQIEYVVPITAPGGQSRGATVVVTIPNPDGSVQPNTDAFITLRSLR